MPSSLPFGYFGLQRVLSQDVSTATVTTNFFGTAISEYLIDNQSKVVAAPAKQQSSIGLVELHWKTMVHMARAYLTEKQMPRKFWFYAVVHSA